MTRDDIVAIAGVYRLPLLLEGKAELGADKPIVVMGV